MKLEEFYELSGGKFDDVKSRLGNVEMIEKFVKKFALDDSFERLRNGLCDNDAKEAFRAAHTLKGICLNLGFGNFYKPVNEITELLRAENTEPAKIMFPEVEKSYNRLVTLIEKL